MKTKIKTHLKTSALASAMTLTLFAAQAGQGPQPTICTRSCWGARNTTCSGSFSTLSRAIIHHTAGAGDWTTDYAGAQSRVRGVQNLHIDGNGWCDVGYHFLVSAGGHIFEGRKNSMAGLPTGAHDGCNSSSFGFNVLGYYHPPYNHTFTSASRASLEAVIAWRMPSSWSPYGSGSYCANSVGTLDGHYRVKSTACPGDIIIPQIAGIRDGVNSRKNGPPPVTYNPGPDAASRYNGNIELFVRTADNRLKNKVYDSATGWSGWGEHATGCTSDPSVVSWDQNRLDVFWRGTDGSLMVKGWTAAGGWGVPVSLGGAIVGGPDAISLWPGRLDVFVRGTDNALHQRVFQNNAWSGWISHGGVLTSDPSAVSWDQNRIDVFVRDGAGALNQKVWTPTGWSGWNQIGGQLLGAPDAVSMRPGRLDIFVRGTDNAMHHIAWELNWGPWESLGGSLTSDPGATSWADNRLDVFVRGSANEIHQKYWTSTGGWSGWIGLGIP